MWKKFVAKAAMWMLPHLSCMLMKIAKHVRYAYGDCAVCECCALSDIECKEVVSRETACFDEVRH